MPIELKAARMIRRGPSQVFHVLIIHMWRGRFQQETAPTVQRFTESISFDWRLYKFDIQGSIAHAAALEKSGAATPEERRQIETGLKDIEKEIDDGQFPFRIELEDVHMNIESALTSRIGSAGAKLHTARSRNDQVALDMRLYLRHETDEIRQRIAALQRALIQLGEKYQDTILPGLHASPAGATGPVCAPSACLCRDVGTRSKNAWLTLANGSIACLSDPERSPDRRFNSTASTSPNCSVFRR